MKRVRTTPRKRPGGLPLLGLLTLGLWLPLVGCLQQITLQPDRAVVKGKIAISGGGGRANIRVDLSGTAPSRVNQSRDLVLTDAGFTDEDGSFVIPTAHDGDGCTNCRWLEVAKRTRHQETLDPGVGGR